MPYCYVSEYHGEFEAEEVDWSSIELFEVQFDIELARDWR
jgi:hypothetical protein